MDWPKALIRLDPDRRLCLISFADPASAGARQLAPGALLLMLQEDHAVIAEREVRQGIRPVIPLFQEIS